MIPGRLDPLAISRISLVATSADVYNSDACTSRTPTPNITAGSTLPLTSTSDGTPNLGRQSSTTSSVTAPTLTASEVELLACFQFPPSVFPAVGESHKERSLEQSPAYASNYNDISSGGAVMPPPPEPTNRTIQSSFEADYSMRSMDYLYQANFYDYIKDESNVATVARHLNHVIKDYKLQPVACGLRWLTGDWSTDSTVRLLRSIMKEWLPDVAGLLVDLIHDGVLNNASGTSAFHANGVGKLTAGLLKGESPDVSAVFMHSLTETWSLKAVSDLIADVDALLGWNEMYFHQFTNSYIACVIHTTSIRSLGLGGSKQKSTRSIFANRPSEATISPTAMDGKRETNEGSAESDSQKENGKENEKSRQIGENGGKAEEGGSTGPQGQVVAGNLDASQTAESGLGKSATLERLASIYQTNLAVCNYRLALANFKLALLENNIQCDLNRTHALNLAASRHSSFSGSTPNLHFGGARKDEDDSDARNKKSLPKGDIRSHFESLISLRWAMSPDESSPADRMDLTGSMSSIRTLRGLDIASREDHESVRLSTLSGVGQHMASLGGPSTGRGRRRRVSCPGRVCHPFWHVDQEEDGDGVGRAAPPVSVPSTERGSRRSSQVSANSANEVRSTRSRTSDRRSSGRSSYAQSRRSSLRRFVRPPPANFLQPSTSSAGSDRPKMTAQDLTIETLNSLSQPAPNLDTEDSQSQSSIHPLVPTVPNSEIRSTPTGSSSILPAHRTESHRPSQYHYRTFCSGRGTSRTSLSSLSSSSSSTSYDPSDAYNHLNAPGHFGYPIYHYPNNTAFSTPAHPEEYDMDSRSLFSGRNRNHHTPGLVSFPFNTNSSTATGEDQEKSLSEINEFLNTNSRPVSTERLEYRRGLNVPGDSRRANVVSGTPVGTRADPATCFVRA